MYNFTVPSQLKAWIDRILVAGKTFHYTAAGAEGLVPGKRIIVGAARGGMYGAGHAARRLTNTRRSYLRTVFGFMGIKNVEFVRAEGIALGPEQARGVHEGRRGRSRDSARLSRARRRDRFCWRSTEGRPMPVRPSPNPLPPSIMAQQIVARPGGEPET